MGVKLFAWLGGFAAFLGVAFGVKYSFEHDLVSKEARATAGFALSFGLVVLGLRMLRSRYKITAQTLSATGVVCLYAVTFACHAIYEFPAFSSSTTTGTLLSFGLMALITTMAFLIAVRTEAQVVAILGILGGFLTPVLISSGHDNPLGLYGYIGLLNAGLAAVAILKRWGYLTVLGAVGTVLIQIGWALSFLRANNGLIGLVQSLAMQAEFVGIYFVARRYQNDLRTPGISAWLITGSALLFCFVVGSDSIESTNPFRLFAVIFAVDALGLSMMWSEKSYSRWSPALGAAVFILLCLWTGDYLSVSNFPIAGGAFLVFAAAHTAFPLLIARRDPENLQIPLFQYFPALGIVLVMIPSLHRELFSFAVWPVILLLDVVAIVAAAFSGMLLGVLAVLALTLFAAANWISAVEATTLGFGSLALIIGGFACVFFAAGLWLLKRVPSLVEGFDQDWVKLTVTPTLLPILSALLPFMLTVVAAGRLNLPEATLLFGLLLVLNVLSLGISKILTSEWVPVCAVLGTAATVHIWVAKNPTAPGLTPLAWILGFNLLFSVFPFIFGRQFQHQKGPWVAAAIGGLSLFTSFYQLCTRFHVVPVGTEGLIPGVLAFVPLAQLVIELRRSPEGTDGRLLRLALFGGAALAFVTLVFPVQFSRQYLTISWAMEGAALCWLYRRIPHRGLTLVGIILLVTSFTRLMFNPAVFHYHSAGSSPIWNWYLAAYGITAASLFIATMLMETPSDEIAGISVRPWFRGGAIALLFLLFNIEIADYFSPRNAPSLIFEFSGNFARDMTYTIAWALFAFLLLVGGVWQKVKLARYVALTLLGISVLKLFFHDLDSLGALYRIGALFAVATIAMLASMVYQRFLSPNEKNL